MKRKLLTGSLILAVVGIVLYTSVAIYAALTKTTSVSTVDAWQVVTGGTLVVGNDADISGSYETILYIESAYVEAAATDGAEYIIEVSYADEQYVQLVTVKGTAETPATTTINDADVQAAETSLTLTDATTGDFRVVGRKWFIKDGTIANSEAVRTVVNSTHTVTITSPLLRAHSNGVSVYDRCDDWAIRIPFGASRVRVLANNVDADCDVAFTTRTSTVTAIQ